ncbi:peptidylprolyl isomerase [Pseudorhodobacter turbinis]|uniref:Peptidylprolyl isomerase n=1 Tax=Pseudorhodobacter turbinis TaxID=2500533 RepID=A0A4P8EE40_9RHOB|nr:SurA N-terminal domain-containing protein [Pseudorhodobacter turbinis]QCO54979.1 peptidylprolyl isomerase [Pseudorhodobacter turbinis]
MANPTDDTPRKKGKGTSVVVWILMGMLVLGLGGFGITNFGGDINAIGKVGDRDISIGDYERGLQQEVNALSAQFGTRITLQQAQSFGIDQQVRQQLVNAAALDNETARIGLSVGDERIVQEITNASVFRGPSGTFDRDTYRFTLQNVGLTEAQYETKMREDLARALLQGAVMGGFAAPAVLTDTLYAQISERRELKLLRLTSADLAAAPAAPTDEEIKAHYDANIAEFTKPEARRITYAALLPEDIADQMPLDDAILQKLYDDRIVEFVQPERRLVERLVFPNEEAAQTAKAALDEGTPFETLVEQRGVTLSDIDLGDKSEEELGEAGAAIFALEAPGVVGPFNSDLGPALFRMNATLAAQNVTFEEARPDLAAELAADAARRAIDDLVEDIDDRLASGATLEDLAAETDLTLGQIDFNEHSSEAMAGYPTFRTAATEAAEGDFPEAVQLEDGGVFALRLDAIIPPTPIPLEEAREAVIESWTAQTTAQDLAAMANDIKAKVDQGEALGGFGITEVIPNLTRSTALEDTPASLLSTVFKMEEGEASVIEDGSFIAVAQLESIIPGPTSGADAEALKSAIAAQAEQAVAQDAFTLFTNSLTQDAGITLDNAVINAVHARFQ